MPTLLVVLGDSSTAHKYGYIVETAGVLTSFSPWPYPGSLLDGQVRVISDDCEATMDDQLWPLPKYLEILFNL